MTNDFFGQFDIFKSVFEEKKQHFSLKITDFCKLLITISTSTVHVKTTVNIACYIM